MLPAKTRWTSRAWMSAAGSSCRTRRGPRERQVALLTPWASIQRPDDPQLRLGTFRRASVPRSSGSSSFSGSVRWKNAIQRVVPGFARVRQLEAARPRCCVVCTDGTACAAQQRKRLKQKAQQQMLALQQEARHALLPGQTPGPNPGHGPVVHVAHQPLLPRRPPPANKPERVPTEPLRGRSRPASLSDAPLGAAHQWQVYSEQYPTTPPLGGLPLFSHALPFLPCR
jgi:hypothetical protein